MALGAKTFLFDELAPGDKFIFRGHRLERTETNYIPVPGQSAVQMHNVRFRSGTLKDKLLFLDHDTIVEPYTNPINGIFEDATGRFFQGSLNAPGTKWIPNYTI